MNDEKNLAVLNIKLKVRSDEIIIFRWYQKSTQIRIIIKFRSCALFQQKNIVQGIAPENFIATFVGLVFVQEPESGIRKKIFKNSKPHFNTKIT